jgi:hypothetical protein
MGAADSGVGQTHAAAPRLDAESAEWLRALAGSGSRQEAALARLHAMLVRIAHGEGRGRTAHRAAKRIDRRLPVSATGLQAAGSRRFTGVSGPGKNPAAFAANHM